MFKRYQLIQTESELILRKSQKRQTLNLIVYLILIIGWYLGIHHQNVDASENPVIYLFYLVPLLLLPKLVRYVKNSIKAETFTFNLTTKRLTHNSKLIATIHDIQKVVIDYDKGEIEECTLELITNREKIKIDKTDASFNKEVIETAKQLSKFLGVSIEDKHPYEEKL